MVSVFGWNLGVENVKFLYLCSFMEKLQIDNKFLLFADVRGFYKTLYKVRLIHTWWKAHFHQFSHVILHKLLSLELGFFLMSIFFIPLVSCPVIGTSFRCSRSIAFKGIESWQFHYISLIVSRPVCMEESWKRDWHGYWFSICCTTLLWNLIYVKRTVGYCTFLI